MDLVDIARKELEFLKEKSALFNVFVDGELIIEAQR